MKGLALTLALGAVLGLSADGGTKVTVLSDWEFQRNGQGPFAKVRVPHDWAIAGEFDPDAVRYPDAKLFCGYAFTGKLPWRGTGVYRRSFNLTQGDLERIARGGRLTFEFDGVMANPRVTVNGSDVGGWDYGYMGFTVDASRFVRKGGNRIEVFATTMWHGARWHPGGGIYREARMVLADADRALPGTLSIVSELPHPDGPATVRVAYDTAVGRTNYAFTVERPHLWATDDPHLYELEIAGERFRYGIRTIEWTADDGFHLNGKRLQIRGVNLHADLGPLGMAFDADAARRQLAILKDMGANAIRTSHNPPAPQFLDLCDEMGFVVWDEGFDKWNDLSGIRPDQNLEEYVTRNMSALVRRDRNHPCVVAWSIGNEIGPATEKYPEGMTKARSAAFREAVRRHDTTRPVAVGADSLKLLETGALDPLDLHGWNYCHRYAKGRARYPKVPVVMSESASAVSSCGFYSETLPANKTDFAFAAREIDSHDCNAAWWSDIPDWEFERMARDRYCAGEFVWSGFDYIGEPTPYSERYASMARELKDIPQRELGRSSSFGIVDLCGIPKDRFFLYRSHWRPDTATVHILPHWNWAGREGKPLPVFVYTNGDEAELFLNGRSLGRRRKAGGDYPTDFVPRGGPVCGDHRTNAYFNVCAKYRLRWLDVPYEPGELRAVARRDGRIVGETVVRTAGRPVAVRLTRDPYQRPHDRTVFVQVDLVDERGVRDPRATDRVRFALRGPGEIVAVGNGNARGLDSFGKTDSHPLYFGKAVAVVRLEGNHSVTLTASVPGLDKGEIVLRRDQAGIVAGRGLR